MLSQVLPFLLAVLPSFEVSLRPQKAFFYVNDDSLAVDIEAKYSAFFCTEYYGDMHFFFLMGSKYKYSSKILEYSSY